MFLTEQQACEQTLVPGITAIVPTYNNSPRLFALSIMSLLRNTSNVTMHINVTINGPDRRTGDPETQNQKQWFLEAIREEKYRDRDMPLTVQRVWSRVGHAQAIDSAMPWVHTKYFLLMHDDVLVTEPCWDLKVIPCLNNPDTGLVFAGRHHALDRITCGPWEDGKNLINFPHPQTYFVAGSRAFLGKFRWQGYFVKGDFDGIQVDKEMIDHQERFNMPPQPITPEAGYLTYDIGSWLLYNVQKSGMQIVEIPEDTVLHLGGFSWAGERRNERQVQRYMTVINDLEVQCREDLPKLFKIYWDMFGDYKFS